MADDDNRFVADEDSVAPLGQRRGHDDLTDPADRKAAKEAREALEKARQE